MSLDAWNPDLVPKGEAFEVVSCPIEKVEDGEKFFWAGYHHQLVKYEAEGRGMKMGCRHLSKPNWTGEAIGPILPPPAEGMRVEVWRKKSNGKNLNGQK